MKVYRCDNCKAEVISNQDELPQHWYEVAMRAASGPRAGQWKSLYHFCSAECSKQKMVIEQFENGGE